MSSPLTDALATIDGDVVSLIPAARPSITYHSLDAQKPLPHGATGDRAFWFGVPEGEVVGLRGEVTEMRWDVTLHLHLASSGRTPRQMRTDIVDEGLAVRAIIDARAAWPAGTIGVETVGVTHEVDESTRDVTVMITLSVWTEESDSYVSSGPLPPVEPDPDPIAGGPFLGILDLDAVVAGDGAAEIGSMALPDGVAEISVSMHCDTSLSDAAAVYLDVKTDGGGLVVSLSTSSTSPLTVGPVSAVVTEGLYRFFARTSSVTGTVRVDRVTVEVVQE